MTLNETKIASIRDQFAKLAAEHNVTVEQLTKNPNMIPFPGNAYAKSLIMAERDLAFKSMAEQWDENGVLKKSLPAAGKRPIFTLIRGDKE